MRHNIRFLLIVTMLLLMTGIGTAQKFVHPGIDMNSADLEYMRNQFWRENNLGRMLMIC